MHSAEGSEAERRGKGRSAGCHWNKTQKSQKIFANRKRALHLAQVKTGVWALVGGPNPSPGFAVTASFLGERAERESGATQERMSAVLPFCKKPLPAPQCLGPAASTRAAGASSPRSRTSGLAREESQQAGTLQEEEEEENKRNHNKNSSSERELGRWRPAQGGARKAL